MRPSWCAYRHVWVASGGARGCPPPVFSQTVNPISTRGADNAHHSTTRPLPGFSDLSCDTSSELQSVWPLIFFLCTIGQRYNFAIGFKLKASDEIFREYLTFSFDFIVLANGKISLFPSLLLLNFIKWTMEVLTCPRCHKIPNETSKLSRCADNNVIIHPALENEIKVEINSINFYVTHFCTIQISIWQNWDQSYKAVATVVQGAVGDDRYWDTIWS